jgi:hypothetical protein
MKNLLAILAVSACARAVQAATITVSPGFNSSVDIEVDTNGSLSGFTVAIGSWDGTNFTQFGSAIFGDTGSVNGVFAATGPAEVNSDVIFVYVGIGATVSTSGGQFALLRTATNTAFPSDVSSVSATQTVNFHNATPGNVVFVTGNNIYLDGNTLRPIPEPSVALLGALGIAGLLRRRR